MFAKVYDTNPQISVFVAVPSLSEDAKKLAVQYNITPWRPGDLMKLEERAS